MPEQIDSRQESRLLAVNTPVVYRSIGRQKRLIDRGKAATEATAY
jgi:hypothetical protein